MKSTFFALAVASAAGSASAAAGSAYSQCGGQGFSGSTDCVSGYSCIKTNEWYSQCLPGAATSAKASTTAKASTIAKATTTAKASTAAKSSTVAKSSTTAKAAAATTASTSVSKAVSGGVSYAGVNIAGLDFGCSTDGTCNGNVVDPGDTGISQMKHFVTDDGLNTFRIPVGWQFLVKNTLGGTLDATNWNTYDKQIQGCLSAGAALCIVDIHNYARWNGAIVGQGGPTDAQFASLWSQIATKYKGNSKIAFGIMNEPHDVTISTWATSAQAAVTAIRKAGATANKILLPGTDWASAGAFISNGSGDALKKITNLDGTTTNLIFDVHRYLDSDNSGTSTTCVTSNSADFTTLGAWLRTNKRQAILTETGGGSSDSTCLKYLCEQFDVLNTYSDVYLGWTGWSAGMFDTSYALSETPTLSGSKWTDSALVTQCVAGKFNQ